MLADSTTGCWYNTYYGWQLAQILTIMVETAHIMTAPRMIAEAATTSFTSAQYRRAAVLPGGASPGPAEAAAAAAAVAYPLLRRRWRRWWLGDN